MKMDTFGVIMAPFELKLRVSEAERTDQPFWAIPDAIFNHIYRIESDRKCWKDTIQSTAEVPMTFYLSQEVVWMDQEKFASSLSEAKMEQRPATN